MQVGIAAGARWEIVAANCLESEHDATGSDMAEAEQEPVAEVDGRAGHGCCVGVASVDFDALGERLEARQRELAGGGAKEGVLLVDGLQGGDVKVGEADRDDDGGKAAARAHVEDGNGPGWRPRGGGGAERRDEVKAIGDVVVQLVLAPRRRQVDPLIPFVK